MNSWGCLCRVGLPAVMLVTTVSVPHAAENPPIAITGFGDIHYVTSRQVEEDHFGLGQLEVDLESTLGSTIAVAAGIAYNADEENFQLGSFTADLHLLGSEGNHLRPVAGIDHSGVIVGRFDVPFGIDWQVYPSIDRKLVSQPLVVARTHGGWNDYGVQLYAETPRFNATAYGTNGFGYKRTSLLLGTPDVEMKEAIGGRVGIKPHKAVEIGASFAQFYDEDSRADMRLRGVDFQLIGGNLTLRGEYIDHALGTSAASPATNTGFYGEATYDLGRFFIVSRYDSYSPFDGEGDLTEPSYGPGWRPRTVGPVAEEAQVQGGDQARLCTGLGWRLREGYELRCEYQANHQGREDFAVLQVAVAF